jgi:hypothetical protein
MVQPSTIATLIDNGAEVMGALMKDRVVSAREREQKREVMEHEKELARIKSDSDGGQASAATQTASKPPSEPEPDPEPEPAASTSTPDDSESRGIESLASEEDCDMCTAILSEIQTLPPEKRARALSDYGRMKRAMESEGTEDAVRAVVDSSEVLGEVMERIV